MNKFVLIKSFAAQHFAASPLIFCQICFVAHFSRLPLSNKKDYIAAQKNTHDCECLNFYIRKLFSISFDAFCASFNFLFFSV
ncbi:MAG: hypothetical protein MR024_01560, partial [Firmicutes bacterium]|nr:hypothetical protein [Bacillota bacterium]